MYRAKSWSKPRRACARIEATSLGLDIRYVVTSLAAGSAEHIYDTLYCARGQAENLIKMHKGQLASDRTSCRSPLANQMRLILHTAAYWLMLTLRDAIPKAYALAKAEFVTIRLRLIKLGARVILDPKTLTKWHAIKLAGMAENKFGASGWIRLAAVTPCCNRLIDRPRRPTAYFIIR